MVRRRTCAVSNHEARGPSFETALSRLLRMRAECVAAEGSSPFSPCGTREEKLRYLFAIRLQCSHAAAIKFSLASGVRNAECADSVTLGSFVNG